MRQVASKIVNLIRRPAPIERHPWDFPELMLMEWIRQRGAALTIYVVGAYLGHEVERLFDTNAVDKIVLFEALPTTAERLRSQMQSYDGRVEVVECAVCDYDGKAVFFENNLPGAGSVLPASLVIQDSYGIKPVYEVEVKATRLDTFIRAQESRPDILWIDVQGAESKVLEGAGEALRSAKLVFIEVSAWTPAYEGGCIMNDLSIVLETFGFRLLQLGTDAMNGTGNALYAKPQTMGLKSLADMPASAMG